MEPQIEKARTDRDLEEPTEETARAVRRYRRIERAVRKLTQERAVTQRGDRGCH